MLATGRPKGFVDLHESIQAYLNYACQHGGNCNCYHRVMPDDPTAVDEVSTIGTRIRDARVALGKTTAWLANELGVSENAVKAIEDSTTKSPTFTNGLRISRALQADAWWLAFGETVYQAAKEHGISAMLGDDHVSVTVSFIRLPSKIEASLALQKIATGLRSVNAAIIFDGDRILSAVPTTPLEVSAADVHADSSPQDIDLYENPFDVIRREMREQIAESNHNWNEAVEGLRLEIAALHSARAKRRGPGKSDPS